MDPSFTPQQDAFARVWCKALLLWAQTAFPKGMFTDVVAWSYPHVKPGGSYSAFTCALVGDGLKVARAFGYLDAEWHAPSAPIAYALKRVLFATEASLTIGRDTVTLPDLLMVLSGQAVHEFANHVPGGLPFDEVMVRLLISPGYPWPENVNFRGPFSYYSAADDEMVDADRPAWLIEVEEDRHTGRDGVGTKVLGVNPCDIFPPREHETIWKLWARLTNRGHTQDVIVAHSMELPEEYGSHKRLSTAIENIKNCGGLLFPSLSVGPIPASNFGPITLVGHLGLVLESLKPYRARRADQWPSWVYEHDAWTSGTGEFMREIAVRLFDELHGHEDWVYGHNVWTLGPPAELFGGPSSGSIPLDTVKQLAASLKRRMRHYKRDMTFEQYEATKGEVAGTVDKYAYGEAKARSVISLDEFPVMIGPEPLLKRMRSFAKGVGYKGRIVTIPDDDHISDEAVQNSQESNRSDYLGYRWSWKVADAIKKLGEPMEIET